MGCFKDIGGSPGLSYQRDQADHIQNVAKNDVLTWDGMIWSRPITSSLPRE